MQKILDAQNKAKLVMMGLTVIELASSVITGVSLLWMFNVVAMVIGCVIGYAIGRYISSLYDSGLVQRYCYAELPCWRKNKYLPASYIKEFMFRGRD